MNPLVIKMPREDETPAEHLAEAARVLREIGDMSVTRMRIAPVAEAQDRREADD